MALAADKFQHLLEIVSESVGDVRNTLAFVGSLVAAYYGCKFGMSTLRGFWTHCVSRIWPRNFAKEYGGTWAVVTGPTRGIGRAYANALARHGMNIALVGRDPVRLSEVRDEIMKHGVSCQYFEIDFAVDKAEDVERKLAKLIELDIGILVNNVGWRNTVGPLCHWEMEKSALWPCVIVNCLSVAVMMRLILPAMVARRRGAVINISSMAAVYPLQLNAVYSASKAFTDFISRAARLEVCWSGVTVQTLMPGFVYTGEHYHYKRPTLNAPSADHFVKCALPTLGFSSRTCGYAYHDLQAFLLTFFGEHFHRFTSGRMMWSRRKEFLNSNKNK